MGKPRQQFCKRGHDTFAEGARNAYGKCRLCANERASEAWRRDPQGQLDRQREWRRKNPEKVLAKQRRFAAKHPGRTKDLWLKYQYGVSLAEFNAMLAGQGGKCAICLTEDPGKKGWCLDHDHDTGAPRGVLCTTCNSGIGHLRDSYDNALRAARYLKNHERKHLKLA